MQQPQTRLQHSSALSLFYHEGTETQQGSEICLNSHSEPTTVQKPSLQPPDVHLISLLGRADTPLQTRYSPVRTPAASPPLTFCKQNGHF